MGEKQTKPFQLSFNVAEGRSQLCPLEFLHFADVARAFLPAVSPFVATSIPVVARALSVPRRKGLRTGELPWRFGQPVAVYPDR